MSIIINALTFIFPSVVIKIKGSIRIHVHIRNIIKVLKIQISDLTCASGGFYIGAANLINKKGGGVD